MNINTIKPWFDAIKFSEAAIDDIGDSFETMTVRKEQNSKSWIAVTELIVIACKSGKS